MSDAFEFDAWEPRFAAFLQKQPGLDAAHGLDHIRRVVHNARRIALAEQADLGIVGPAAWLHDCVSVEKNSPLRAQASTLSADAACLFLKAKGYPAHWLDDIHHAIRAHSFSAGIPPETLEACVVQDADRLDALGAVGLARCFMVGERLGLPLYHPKDPFSRSRAPDDRQWILDHFYVKLLTLPDTMQTETGRREAHRRAEFLKQFLHELAQEVPLDPNAPDSLD